MEGRFRSNEVPLMILEMIEDPPREYVIGNRTYRLSGVVARIDGPITALYDEIRIDRPPRLQAS